MSELILDPKYWKRRLREAGDTLHHAIFKCPLEQWNRIADKHREILARHIRPEHSVLDCGCGWGRLLTLLPKEPLGPKIYVGVDLSQDFINLAKEHYPTKTFCVGDLRYLDQLEVFHKDKIFSQLVYFDWAILISIRPMMKRHLGDEVWAIMEANIRQYAKKLLYLEYDPNDEGSVE